MFLSIPGLYPLQMPATPSPLNCDNQLRTTNLKELTLRDIAFVLWIQTAAFLNYHFFEFSVASLPAFYFSSLW
jgi:hypothetical protein